MSACVSCGQELAWLTHYRFKSPQFRSIYSNDAIYACTACNLQQARMDCVDMDGLGRYYQDQYREVAGIGTRDGMFLYRPRAESLAALAREHAPRNTARIFEVGAGHGLNLLALGEVFPDAQLFTDEVDQTVTRHERVAQKTLEDGPYDIVLMSHVLEHFGNPGEMVERAAAALGPDGVLLIEVPNETADALAVQTFHEPHLIFFQQQSLGNLLDRSVAVSDVFTVGGAIQALTTRNEIVRRIKGAARRMPGLRTVLDRRRKGLRIDMTSKQSNGVFLRAVAHRV